MKRTIILNALAGIAIAMLGSSCAELPETTDNQKHMHFIGKWIEVWNKNNDKEAVRAGRGIYILNDEVNAAGNAVEKDDYVIVEYDVRDLEGNVAKTTHRELAQKVGLEVAKGDYFGPEMMATLPGLSYAGVIDGLMGMKEGSTREFLVPSWLMSFKDYKTAEDFENEKSDTPDAIYSITLRERAKDYKEYEKSVIMDALELYSMTDADTVAGTPGIWYKTLEALPEAPKEEEGKKDEESKVDTTYMMIDYTGTHLTRNYGEGDQKVNRRVFDTSIKRIAKDAGIFNPSAEYKTHKVTWGEKVEDTKMDGSTLIRGFNEMAWQMKKTNAKRAVAIFWSDLGYGRPGSGKSIPAYVPLVFEVERTTE